MLSRQLLRAYLANLQLVEDCGLACIVEAKNEHTHLLGAYDRGEQLGDEHPASRQAHHTACSGALQPSCLPPAPALGHSPHKGWSQEPASHRRQVARESLTEVNSSSVCVTTFLSAVALAERAAALGVAMEPDDDDEDYESDETWESDLDSEAEIAEIMQLDIAEDTANTGKKEYLAK